jgi:hypothetical protein
MTDLHFKNLLTLPNTRFLWLPYCTSRQTEGVVANSGYSRGTNRGSGCQQWLQQGHQQREWLPTVATPGAATGGVAANSCYNRGSNRGSGCQQCLHQGQQQREWFPTVATTGAATEGVVPNSDYNRGSNRGSGCQNTRYPRGSNHSQ